MKTQRNLALLAAATFLVWGCDVDQTEEGEMPDVDVQGGNLPKYDIEGPDVDIGTREETVTVPDIDIDMPDDDDMDDEMMDDPENP
ncbi:MAG TPA: hypothetical protein VM616_06350 [Gammaproteobacteria bacterium]|nr:hypothetical protein [Gammaproteobacteria bacterium]